MATRKILYSAVYWLINREKMKNISITLLIISTMLSCSSPTEKDKRQPGTYQVLGFKEKIEISTLPEFDASMARLETTIDSILNQVRPNVDSIVDSFTNQFTPFFDSINEAYGWTEDHSKEYNFEIDHAEKIIIFYEKGEPHKTYYYQRIEPLGNSRKYVITDIESFIFYGDVDSVSHSLGETFITLYK